MKPSLDIFGSTVSLTKRDDLQSPGTYVLISGKTPLTKSMLLAHARMLTNGEVVELAAERDEKLGWVLKVQSVANSSS